MALVKFKLFGKEITTRGSIKGNPFTSSQKEEVLAISGSSVDGDPFSFVDRDTEKKETEMREVVLCPRCDSPDTKFCYFNNYNTNQPRHFCKNCQRYWTAGGALRNLPVGSGCRKKAKSTIYAVSGTDGSAELLKSSSVNVVMPLISTQSVSRDDISLAASREALPAKGSKECLNDSEPSLEPIKSSSFHFHVSPCPHGYGLRGIGGKGGVHGSTPSNAIAKHPLLAYHPRETLQTIEIDGRILKEPQEVAYSSIWLLGQRTRINQIPLSTTIIPS